MYYLNKKRQNYDKNGILWKIKEIMQLVSKIQHISTNFLVF